MSKLVELYASELTHEGSTMTIEDVPAGLREQVAVAIAIKQTEAGPARPGE